VTFKFLFTGAGRPYLHLIVCVFVTVEYVLTCHFQLLYIRIERHINDISWRILYNEELNRLVKGKDIVKFIKARG
jgi:hypothetical protein